MASSVGCRRASSTCSARASVPTATNVWAMTSLMSSASVALMRVLLPGCRRHPDRLAAQHSRTDAHGPPIRGQRAQSRSNSGPRAHLAAPRGSGGAPAGSSRKVRPLLMFRPTYRLQSESKPDQPDPVYAHKLQELIGGAYGDMTVTMQYLFQGWNCRMPGKYKDLIMDIATEEMGHVEMIATMIARLLEGAPATATTKAAAADPVVGAVLGGMDPQQAIVAGGGALLADSNGYPWNGRYIVASGN